MTEVNRIKRLVAVGLAVVALVGGAVVLRQLANTLLSAASGADPTSIFNDVPPAPADVREGISWLPDANDGREMEPRTRVAITDAYARALAAVDRAGRGDAAAPLADYLNGPALEAAVEFGAADAAVSTATLYVEQLLRLDFYSDDGSVVAVGVPSIEVVRVVDLPDGSRTVVTTEEARRLVMLLQDGNWRVEQIETVAADRLAAPPASAAPFDRLDGANALSAQSFDPTWQSYDPDVAAAELERLASVGLDSVRVFVAGPEFGEIDVDAIESFLDLAAEAEVAVVPVLFDGSADHSVSSWRDDAEYLTTIVGGLAGHEAIAAWDLKNEPDLDDERSGGPAVVDAWLDRTAAHLRRIDAVTPLTIGWSSSVHAERVLAAIDVVSFHHFDDAALLADELRRLEGRLGGRSVFVSEYGRPSWVGYVRGDQPAAQAEAIAELRRELDSAGVSSAVWQLRDGAVGNEPGWVAERASASYGLFDEDGAERPAADVVRRGADAVPSPGVVERIRGWLPTIVLGLVLVGFVAAILRFVRGRRPSAHEAVRES